MIKQISCLKFDYDGLRASQDMVLDSRFRFAVQAPRDPSLPERAVVVHFSAVEGEGRFKLLCICRVVFAFEDGAEIPEEEELLRLYRRQAYDAMREMTNGILNRMNQNEVAFPELNG